MHLPTRCLLWDVSGISHLIGAPALSSQTATNVLPDLISWQPYLPFAQTKNLGVILTVLFLLHPTSIEIF